MQATPDDAGIVRDAALALHDVGCCVIPVRADGSKMPACRWKTYQTERPTREQVEAWFTLGYEGVGIVCGAVSDQLEMLELEGRAVAEDILTRFAAALTDHGHADLWARLSAGYLERTPSGGLHWLYRVAGTARGNLKLARRPATDAELAVNPDDKVKTLIETRGEGGFTVVAPSGGATHETGQPWSLLAGSPATIPTISEDERDALHALASMFDTMPTADPEPPAAPRTGTGARDGAVRPGDDYNARATWDEILTPHGWAKVTPMGNGHGWRRPGKNAGISATTGQSTDGVDRLYVFSSSTLFEPEKPYTKFAAYALLEHGGNYSNAAKALAGAGYGTPSEPHRPVDPLAGLIPPDNLARLPQPDDRPRLAVVSEATLQRSDDANALLLIDRFGENIRYCTDRGRWLAWDGIRWQWCDRTGGVVREYAKRVARSLPEDDNAALMHKRRSLGAIGTSAMIVQAATDSRITVELSDLDAHPWELNTPHGIVDLRTGAVSPADPSRLHTRMTACAPDPDADDTTWRGFLTETFGDDSELVAYLQRLVGYSAVGVVGPHVLPFCFGSGGNGKGVFLESLMKVLGDYATTAPSGFLMATLHAKHETELARLAGARMVLCSEVNEDDHFDEAKVKQLTGGDTITARFMHQDHFTFTPTHQLWLMGNHKPSVRSGGHSFWRRLRLIPFLREVPDEKIIDDLQGIFAREYGGVLLAWIIQGAVEYAKNGLRDPASVKAATTDYAHDQDTVSRFLEERCHVGGGEYVKTKVAAVRHAYERWCTDAGETPVSAKAFGIALSRHGIESTRTKSARLYVGLGLLSDDENASPDSDDYTDRWHR